MNVSHSPLVAVYDLQMDSDQKTFKLNSSSLATSFVTYLKKNVIA